MLDHGNYILVRFCQVMLAWDKLVRVISGQAILVHFISLYITLGEVRSGRTCLERIFHNREFIPG